MAGRRPSPGRVRLQGEDGRVQRGEGQLSEDVVSLAGQDGGVVVVVSAPPEIHLQMGQRAGSRAAL